MRKIHRSGWNLKKFHTLINGMSTSCTGDTGNTVFQAGGLLFYAEQG